jgi:hypothetical protein
MDLKQPQQLYKFPKNFEVRQLQKVNKIDYDVMFKHSLNDALENDDFEKLLKVAEKSLNRISS